MKKDFDQWNNQKKIIDSRGVSKFFHEREIWWCSLGINIGFEHNGDKIKYQRPVLILRGLSAYTCFVIPLTSSNHKHLMRVPLGIIDNKEAFAIISQLRVVDTKRLTEKICSLDQEKFNTTRKATRDLL